MSTPDAILRAAGPEYISDRDRRIEAEIAAERTAAAA